VHGPARVDISDAGAQCLQRRAHLGISGSSTPASGVLSTKLVSLPVRLSNLSSSLQSYELPIVPCRCRSYAGEERAGPAFSVWTAHVGVSSRLVPGSTWPTTSPSGCEVGNATTFEIGCSGVVVLVMALFELLSGSAAGPLEPGLCHF